MGKGEENSDTVLYKESEKSLLLFDPRHKGVNRRYCFDKIFWRESTEHIFGNEVQPHLTQLFYGDHLTIFAHGATASGKTFTMERYGWFFQLYVPEKFDVFNTFMILFWISDSVYHHIDTHFCKIFVNYNSINKLCKFLICTTTDEFF